MNYFITEIVSQKNGRYKIYLNEEEVIVLYKGEVNKYKMCVGKELSLDHYNEITKELLPKRAKRRVMNLLSKKMYTQKELEEKLQKGEYPRECIHLALEYVKSFGYVNDDVYTKSYIDSFSTSKSLRQIKEDLKKKGISTELIQEKILEFEEENSGKSDQIIAQKYIRKKLRQKSCEYKELEKIKAYLFRKGIPMETIKKALEIALDEANIMP